MMRLCSISRPIRVEPMNPAPPVMKIVLFCNISFSIWSSMRPLAIHQDAATARMNEIGHLPRMVWVDSNLDPSHAVKVVGKRTVHRLDYPSLEEIHAGQ